MSSETESNGRMAQRGPGHPISIELIPEIIRSGDIVDQENLHHLPSPPTSQLVNLNPRLHYFSLGNCYTRIRTAETGAPLAALIAAAYIPS